MPVAQLLSVRHHYTFMRYFMAMLFALVALAGCSHKSDNPCSNTLLRAQSDALHAKIVLTELRDRRLTNATELLEMQIDTSVIVIDHSLSIEVHTGLLYLPCVKFNLASLTEKLQDLPSRFLP